jgi:hypothetical protein
MRKISYFILQVAIYIGIQTQVQGQQLTEQDLQDFSAGKFIITTSPDALYEGVKGTPYFNEKWQPGDVAFSDGTEIIQISIRYNIYKDELEFKNSTSGQTFIIDRNMVEGFRFSGAGDTVNFKYFSLKPDKKEEKSCVQVLYDSRTMLLLKHKKQFVKADYQGAYAAGNKYDEYLNDNDYFLVKTDGSIQKMKPNKRSVMSALTNSQSELKEYALKNQIDFSDPDDVIRMLRFYDNITINQGVIK